MNITNIVKWLFRILIFVLILILIIDNIQTVHFNILGIYFLQVPLIVLVLIFFALGVSIGLLMGFMNNMKLKSRIHQLEQVATTTKN
jgi:putative membrane protein